MKRYAFESANMGTVEIDVFGEYRDGYEKDMNVCHAGNDRDFTTDDADAVMQWLVDEGVEFESDRSMAFNRAVIQSVLIDRDETVEHLLDQAAGWTEAEIESKLQFIER